MTLQEIIDWDIAVPASKLVKITGYSRVDIAAIDPPFVRKKIRPSDFWGHVKKLQKQFKEKPKTIEHPQTLANQRNSLRDTSALTARIMA